MVVEDLGGGVVGKAQDPAAVDSGYPSGAVAQQPAVVFGFVGAEVVEDDVNVPARIAPHHFVHEVQKLAPPPPTGVPTRHFRSAR